MKFNSGRPIPLYHVIRWISGQLAFLVFLLGPFVLLALFLTGQWPTT